MSTAGRGGVVSCITSWCHTITESKITLDGFFNESKERRLHEQGDAPWVNTYPFGEEKQTFVMVLITVRVEMRTPRSS